MNRDRTPPRSYRYDDEPGPHVGTVTAATVLGAVMLFIAVCLWVTFPR